MTRSAFLALSKDSFVASTGDNRRTCGEPPRRPAELGETTSSERGVLAVDRGMWIIACCGPSSHSRDARPGSGSSRKRHDEKYRYVWPCRVQTLQVWEKPRSQSRPRATPAGVPPGERRAEIAQPPHRFRFQANPVRLGPALERFEGWARAVRCSLT